jgi:hypothetical protein
MSGLPADFEGFPDDFIPPQHPNCRCWIGGQRQHRRVWCWQLRIGDRVVVSGTLLTCRHQKQLYQELFGLGVMRIEPVTEEAAFGG